MRLLGVERVEQLGPQHVRLSTDLSTSSIYTVTGQYSRCRAANLRRTVRAGISEIAIPRTALDDFRYMYHLAPLIIDQF
jgi:hypothetical protein